jgi:hypothetical protein
VVEITLTPAIVRISRFAFSARLFSFEMQLAASACTSAIFYPILAKARVMLVKHGRKSKSMKRRGLCGPWLPTQSPMSAIISADSPHYTIRVRHVSFELYPEPVQRLATDGLFGILSFYSCHFFIAMLHGFVESALSHLQTTRVYNLFNYPKSILSAFRRGYCCGPDWKQRSPGGQALSPILPRGGGHVGQY